MNIFYKVSFKLLALAMLIFLSSILTILCYYSYPSLKLMGIDFYLSGLWEPYSQQFGILVFIIGTLLTSILAVLISIPFALSIAIFINFLPIHKRIKRTFQIIIDTLAGVPSIIYGFWGLTVLCPKIGLTASFFKQIPYGVSLLSASLILAVMITPLSAAIITDLLKLLPKDYKEAAFSLGATQFETIRFILLPMIGPGLISAFFVSFSRALSETMAVTMVIGNVNKFPSSIFAPTNTLASVIANEFGEAIDPTYLSALIHLGLVLLIITLITNITARNIYKLVK